MRNCLKIMAGLGAMLVLLTGAFVFYNWAPDRPVEALQARWAPPPSVFIPVVDMNVHLRDEGPRDDAMPIVLLHGTSSSLHTWEGWARALKEQRRVIRFDLPGFGLTGPSADNVYTIERYTRFVAAVLDHLGVQRCVLAGNSFGGYVAWATSLAYPALVAKLILVDASGYRLQAAVMPIGFRIAMTPVLNRLAANTLPRFLIASSLKNVYGDPGKVTENLIDRYVAITVREGNRHALVERFKQAPPGEMADRIPEVNVPTLILWGGRDRLILPAMAERFHHDIAGSHLKIFEDLGHVPQEEAPARTVAVVKQFLDR
ncbi:MAG: alpha/beta hydrolase [Deltaproteobacteria bacterium]|nr:alpha/beta hydrolase [Deltaproteobacteria bacterium]